MENINGIACQLLNCWYLDIEFLERLLEAYPRIDLYIDELEMSYWKVDNINILIYEAYTQIKEMFLKDNKSKIEALGFKVEDFEEWREFEIFTNYMDSHLWFNESDIDKIYQNWRRH